MRTTKTLLSMTLLALMALVPTARAEGPQTPNNGSQQNGSQQVMGQPTGDASQGAVMGQPQPQPEAQQSANEQARRGRGIEYGGYLYVPVFVASKTNGLGPGIGFQARVGWEFGSGFTAELQGGLSWNSTDSTLLGSSGLTDAWIGVGARYAFLNPSPFVPFVGVGLNVNLWGLTRGGSDNNIAIGANLLAGAAYEVSADVAIEGGLQVFGTSDKVSGTSIFGGQVAIGLAPFLGATLYY